MLRLQNSKTVVLLLLHHIVDEAVRIRIDHIEQHEESHPEQLDHLEGAVVRREVTQDLGHSVVCSAGLHVAENLDFAQTEHNAEAHRHSQARFLLLGGQDTLAEGAHQVEAHSEAEAPINIELGLAGEVYILPELCVFRSALHLLQAVESLFCSGVLCQLFVSLRYQIR